MAKSQPALKAYTIRVTRPDPDKAGAWLNMFYAVLTDTPDHALKAVREALGPASTLNGNDVLLSQDTVEALRLEPHIPRRL